MLSIPRMTSLPSSLIIVIHEYTVVRSLMEDANIATDKPIAFKSTAEDIALVNGFIRIYATLMIPKSIIQFILRTYLRILFVDNYTNTDNRILQWAFTTKHDVDQYKKCVYNDVMHSCKFSINHCIFYFECTPRGWGTYKDVIAVWCALHELPEHVSRISVHFQCKCDAIGYDEEETEILTTKTSSKNSSSWLHGKTWSMLPNKLVNDTEFDDLDAFIFECTVKYCMFLINLGMRSYPRMIH
eukprot:845803_1